MSNFTHTENYQLMLWDLHKPAQRRILITFLRYYRKNKYKQIKEVFPERETLAFESECSLRTVKRYINCEDDENFKLVMEKKVRRNFQKGKHTSNIYENFNKPFFDFLEKMDELGWLKNYKKHRKWINEEVIKYDGFVHEKWMKKRKLSTTKRAAVEPPKRATIKTSSYGDTLNNSTKNKSANDKCSRIKEALLREEKLLRSTVIWIRNNLLPHIAIAVKQDLDWFGRHKMRSIDGYIVDSVKRNSRKYFEGKNS